MQKTKLLSYTTIDFPSKAQMNLYIKYIEQIENDISNSEKLLNAGLVRRTHSQIWNSKMSSELELPLNTKMKNVLARCRNY